MSRLCSQRHQSRSYQCNICSGWVHAKCSGLLNAAQYQRSSDWACDPCSTPPQTPSPPPTPTSHTNTSSDASMFNVLQLEVKVAVIQQSSSRQNPRTPASGSSPQYVRSVPMAGGGLLIFIHDSITFFKQPSSPEALSDPHLEELTIKTDIRNTKFIVSNIYIPPASSCSNEYQSSIEHLLTTPDTLILGDFNAYHPAWYSISSYTRIKRMDDPTRVLPNTEPSSPDVSLASTSLITSCSWHTMSTLSSDHLPILIRLQMTTTTTRVYVKPMST